MSKIQAVADAVAAGKAKLVGGLVQEALDDGCQAVDVLNAMIDAMGVVGERFKNNEIFVPEMLVAARAMKKGVEVLFLFSYMLSPKSVGIFADWSVLSRSLIAGGFSVFGLIFLLIGIALKSICASSIKSVISLSFTVLP